MQVERVIVSTFKGELLHAVGVQGEIGHRMVVLTAGDGPRTHDDGFRVVRWATTQVLQVNRTPGEPRHIGFVVGAGVSVRGATFNGDGCHLPAVDRETGILAAIDRQVGSRGAGQIDRVGRQRPGHLGAPDTVPSHQCDLAPGPDTESFQPGVAVGQQNPPMLPGAERHFQCAVHLPIHSPGRR